MHGRSPGLPQTYFFIGSPDKQAYSYLKLITRCEMNPPVMFLITGSYCWPVHGLKPP